MSPCLAANQLPRLYSFSEKFVKQLVGRTDVEDALQRLEKVTVEEARMAATEALKAIHGVGDKVEDGVQGIHDAVKAVESRVRNVEGMIQGVGDMLHGVDERVKGIGDVVIIGAPNMVNFSSLFLMFIPSGVGKKEDKCQTTLMTWTRWLRNA